ncbi:DNA polymerase III subunit epsilon [Alkalisalibacterium limincola]|uniref:DNA polymerase III subunit epsilon n=1 Tax=Alkalisalibacterium limincola TaxID=2699169 RepID=A0A5C8L167_9GAMM|nr:DNA polymerase III subunit epsilon [Alkalisalibacterium limincola]TXK65893.1 DNA polymerase III subunit epsilon [Alkalisalibacterium limincola]
MRQIVLDTETTGLSWEKGNRVVEIGCLEMLERRPTGRHFHYYLNPDRDMEPGAEEVTGLTREFLSDKPRFPEIAREFLEFIEGSELVIHNAVFDVGFLDYELSLLGPQWGRVTDRAMVLDSLAMARERFPGQRNSLDALCRRLGVDNAHRKLHGALLDAELLAEVYLALTSGQSELGFDAGADEAASPVFIDLEVPQVAGKVLRADTTDIGRHQERLASIARKAGGEALWSTLQPD